MRRHTPTRQFLLLLLTFGMTLSHAAGASTDWPSAPSRLALDTPYGTLQVTNNEYIYESRLRFNDADVTPEVQGLLNIPYAFSLPSSQIALVSIHTGDENCPVSYRWIVLQKDGYTLSPVFGSCSEQIKVTVKGNTFLVQTPSKQKPDKIDVYAYDGKNIRKRTKP
ncbi:MAG TPA: hypothetical protein VKZ66_00650 [Pusillimonas sp.]|jgi:hypothetical protein|uniref:hypothetical protein n=1 Tax=unclassified Pusillimonas TaxID=2640016 RepID=UPI002637FC8B|nr:MULTISPECIES: hypothetical protein [unclassified Pusillimonas]HLU18441.1 hypothetical protein [Pusillimonas sp.]